MITQVVDLPLSLRIDHRRRLDLGKKPFVRFYDGEGYGFTVSNQHYTTLVSSYWHHFGMVDTVEATL